MRQRLNRSPLIPLLLAFAAAPLAAQESATLSANAPATPSVEGYLCAFAGKCDGATLAPTATRDAPETRGFRLARPSADSAAPRPAASPVRSPVAAAVRPARVRQPNYGVRATARPYVAAPAPFAAAGRPRADLLIGFQLNSAELSAEGQSAAQVFARSLLLPELRAKRFVIEGHTDLRGGAAVNAALSARRAEAVAGYLAAQGVSRDRLEPRGFGSAVPLPGHRAADPANRRVEAELIP